MLKINDRFGDVTIVSIKRETIELVCSCGHIFRKNITQAEKTGIRTQCTDCCKTKVELKMPERNIARDFTEQELKYIADFERENKRIKNEK